VNKTEVHVWTTSLTTAGTEKYGLVEVLSPDERQRADAFRFDKHKNSFIVGRALLRFILGRYLERAPKDITFSYGTNGKPKLADSNPPLHFNLAHSENRVVYAFTTAGELGVDIEPVRSLPDFESIACKFFSAEESAQVLSLPADQRAEGFFNCWTRKEAYLKAVGDGLMVPLNSFQVSLLPGQPAAFLKMNGDAQTLSQWSLFHLDFPDRYIGALAIPFPGCALHWWSFPAPLQCFEYLRKPGASLQPNMP
jgi:4'-phosphopantetheinyl transferase